VRTFDDPITLHQVHAFERDVEARVVGIAEEHEFATVAIGFDLAEPFELADTVIHVNDEVSGSQFGEIGEEAGGADFVAGALDRGGHIEKISVAKDGQPGFRKSHAFGKRCANQQQAGGFQRAFGGETGGGVFRFAEDVRHVVFAGDVGEAFELAGACSGEESLPA